MVSEEIPAGDAAGKSADTSAPRYRLTTHQRLHTDTEFRQVYEQRCRASDERLLIYARPNDRGLTRIGLSVSRKHGSAVKRVRLKRLLREAFRLVQHELPANLDLILIPQQGAVATLDGYRRSLVKQVRYLARKLQQRADAPPARQP